MAWRSSAAVEANDCVQSWQTFGSGVWIGPWRSGGLSSDLSPMDVGRGVAVKTSAAASIDNPTGVDCDKDGTYD